MPDLQPLIQLPWGRLALLFLCIYIFFVALAFLYADKILFPAPTPPACLEKEVDFFVSTESGIRIACARRIPQAPKGPVILYSHGNGEDLGHTFAFLDEVADKGFEIIAYDYPGYGVSGGEPAEEGCYEAIEAVYRHMTGELSIDPSNVVLWGRSLGTGPSCHLAATSRVAGILLETPFLSAFRTLTEIPVLPWDRFRNLEKIPDIHCPSLVVHGNLDEVIPFRHGKKVHELLPEPKSFLEVDGARHNDLRYKGGARYEEVVGDFLDRFIRG
ncbi:MAG TPA: hypothetical protein DCX67_00565 [Opitutae bacterium]|nr:hypothetical protein [Opitutae bacterium]|tara:strand:+ start:30534 stop:31349 length:816 start_codon:yes stop_codon:yes gene_type:complete